MRFLRTGLWAGFAALCVLIDAGAQVCAERADVVAHLSAKYGERLTARGREHRGTVVELFAAGDGRTWTLVVTMPDGATCLVAAGEGWTDVPRKEGDGA